MDIFINHFWEWAILLLLIGGAIYTMKIIGEEKSTFKDESYEVQFEKLSLMIPNWWTIVEQTPSLLRFERTDTRYDWRALFAYIPNHQNKSMPDLLEEKLNLENRFQNAYILFLQFELLYYQKGQYGFEL